VVSSEPSAKPLPPPPRPPDVEFSIETLRQRPGQFLTAIGEIVRFSARVVVELPLIRLYLSEALRQAGVLVISSGLVIWTMMIVIGQICGLESHYLLQQVGAPLYSGVFASYCGLREAGPLIWGYILSAKVGCGIVAEIGSMRISDEVDALEVMGIRSTTYLAGTRLVAAWIALPFIYLVGIGLLYVALYLTIVTQLAGVSKGGYLYIFWLFQTPFDLFASLVKAMVMGTTIVLVAGYYGYHSSGGPVGVGRNTSKSMVFNLVLVHVISLFSTALFWGFAANAPIAN
jgi:phospholipid/cholesterol/gamma-HCH transport system permease protein